MRKREFNIAQAKCIIEYDPKTGLLRWKDKGNKKFTDWFPGYQKGNGYKEIDVCGTRILVHRLAWAFVYNEHPVDLIDHINGDRSDNRITNLRSVTDLENNQNIAKPTKVSKTGVRGVHFSSRINRWIAQITVNRKCNHLGCFKSLEEAKEAYMKAKQQFHSAPILALEVQ